MLVLRVSREDAADRLGSLFPPSGPVEPVQANVDNQSYPISRFLYIYINIDPAKGADPLVKEFMKYVCSKQGQEVTIKDGYFPLHTKKSKEMMDLIN